MDADRFDSGLRRRIARGGHEAGVLPFGATRQAAIGRVRHPDHLVPPAMAERNTLSAALLAERDLAGVDYAAGAGY